MSAVVFFKLVKKVLTNVNKKQNGGQCRQQRQKRAVFPSLHQPGKRICQTQKNILKINIIS